MLCRCTKRSSALGVGAAGIELGEPDPPPPSSDTSVEEEWVHDVERGMYTVLVLITKQESVGAQGGDVFSRLHFIFIFTFNAFVDMLASRLITLSFLALPFTLVVSQTSSSNNTQLGIAVIEANFENAGIVPSLLAQFDPTALLTVSFVNGDLTPGQNLSQSG